MRSPRAPRLHAIAAAIGLCLASAAQAQLSTATIKGQITGEAGAAPPAGTVVVAVNTASGFTHRATALADGSYTLTGLPPGEYELRVTAAAGTAKTQKLTLQVGETAAVNLALSKTEEIVVTGTARRKNVKTSEVGTNVSPKMIEVMPQSTRNFLSSADLAPGVAFIQDAGGNTRIQSGAQNHDNVNVFIDGTSQKNNILRGGLTGQDSSRGNPFPQSAIAEYKVVTQNYKAEYDQVSSAAITAVTKSGGNELHGDVYYDRTETDWRKRSPLEMDAARSGQVLMPSSKGEYGASVGGPIKEGVVNYFLAYDGKDINDSRQVLPQNLDKLSGASGPNNVVPTLAAKGGSYIDPFTEHLVFGKVNAQLAEDRRLTVSTKLRLESDRLPENRTLSAHGNDKDRTNNEFRLDLLHEWTLGGDWVSETRAGYQNAVWNPKSASTTPLVKYKVSTAATPTLTSSSDVIWDGGSPDAQKRGQSGVTLGQDMSYLGLPGHVFKSGAKLAAMRYDLSGTSRSVDIVETLVDTASGQPYFNGSQCTGTNPNGDNTVTDQCKIQRALAPASVGIDNTQLGLYVQDDWAITRQLEVNVGVRWDYETNMLNNGYVTPSDRVAVLFLPDTRPGAAPGQTYADSMAKSGLNVGDYIADGHSRKAFLGAVAPRVGFSYDVLADKGTVVFGGWGRSYDRTMANHALDEKQKNAQALDQNGEIWLIRNQFKMPYTDQMSIGVRQGVVDWNVEAVVAQVDGRNQFQWFSGNRDPNGGWGGAVYFDPYWGGGPADATGRQHQLIMGDFGGRSRTRSLMLKAEKPYTRASGWTATVAYTLSDAKTTHNDWNDDIFDWTYGKPNRGWNTSRLIDRHRLVAAAMMDNLLPWGATLSGKYTFGSGIPRRVVDCTGPCTLVVGDSRNFHQVDVGVSKRFNAGPGFFAVRADLLNVLNSYNYVLNDDLSPRPNGDLRGPMRTLLVTGSYSF
jgi:hypothetical protein